MTDFLQGFKWKETINLAPDCFVWVQQDATAPVCPVCGSRKSFQSDITNVSISHSTESSPSTATFTIEVPRHGMTKYDIGGQLPFKPMMEVEIWMKGRYLVNGEPRYYPVFWGLITGVNLSTTPEMWTINVQCSDILYWWNMTTLTVNPAVLEAQLAGTVPFPAKHVFSNFNPYEIILALALVGFGDIVALKDQGLGDSPQFVRAISEDIRDRRDEIIRYWQRRFQQVARRLKIFGINGYRLNRDVSDINVEKFAEEFWDQARAGAGGRDSRQKLPGLLYDLDQFSRFRFDEFIGANDSLSETEQQTKMEIAQNAAASIGFEFFMDVNGDVIFKPPFFNMDVRDAGPVYRISEQEIVNLDFNIDANQVYTRADVVGRFSQLMQEDGAIRVYGTYVDYDLTRHYGVRNLELRAPYIRTARGCYMYGVAKLSEQNARAFSANLTIMGRPEIRLGRPVYIEPHDLFGYVTGITHSFSFGGTYTTVLTLSALRPKYHRTDPFSQFTSDRNSFAVLSDGSTQGDPNRVMIFRSEVIKGTTDLRVVDEDDRGFSALSGQETATTRSQFNEAQNAAFSQFEVDALREDRELRETYGTAQGFWIEGAIPGVFTATERFIPVSDEFGYRHIGGFPYGRGMTIGALEAVVPYTPDSTSIKGYGALDSRDLENRTPSVLEQYGLTAGRAFDGPEIPLFLNPDTIRQIAETAEGYNVNDPSAEAAGEEELQSLKAGNIGGVADQAARFREFAKEQVRRNPAGLCSCTGDVYAGALIDKIIAENRGGPSAARFADQANQRTNTPQPTIPPSQRTAPPPSLNPNGSVVTPG